MRVSPARIGGSVVLILSGLLAGSLSSAKSASEQAPARDEIRDGANRFRSRLRGLWVQQEYADAIRREHSPFAAAELFIGVTDVRYDSMSDSLILGVNHHEGVSGHIKPLIEESRALLKEKGLSLGVWTASLEGYDFRFEPAGVDSVLQCTGFDGEWKLIRVNQNPERTLEHFVQAEICGGRFVLEDSQGKTLSRDVSIYADGSITGFESFERYQIWTDFNDDVPRMDTVRFFDAQGAETWFAWSWKPETIELYTLESVPSAASERGKLAYTLIRLTDPMHVLGR